MTISGAPIVLRGDDVDTDRIIPARFLKAISFDGLEAHVFADDRAAARARQLVHPFDDETRAGAAILIVNANFGCGSSREHAPQALRRRGIRALVGTSFGEIFFGNAAAIGLPCLTADAADVERLMSHAEAGPALVTVDVAALRVRLDGARGERLDVAAQLPETARQAFLDGSWDATGELLRNYDDVLRTAARLPYLTDFRT